VAEATSGSMKYRRIRFSMLTSLRVGRGELPESILRRETGALYFTRGGGRCQAPARGRAYSRPLGRPGSGMKRDGRET
jgi:hypothetical protein